MAIANYRFALTKKSLIEMSAFLSNYLLAVKTINNFNPIELT
jgi:hypothetical protein